MQTVLKISPLLLLVACTFDSSALSSKDGCRSDSDCTIGWCVESTCEPIQLDPGDVGADPLLDLPSEDTEALCDGASLNACGGCNPLESLPGDRCPDSCGTLRCGSDGETLVCEPTPENPCGGCTALDARPGSECGTCGEWQCDGPDALLCDDPGTNECGGCEVLDTTLGTPCGLCGGDWMCAGEDATECFGGEPDACGTCEGPADVAEGDVCECDGEYPARWACADRVLECGDGDDSVARPVILPASADNSDVAVFAQGTLHSGDDTDWFSIDVADTDDLLDGLFPLVVPNDVPVDRRICAFWQYNDRRDWRLRCAGESIYGLIEGADACCVFGDTSDSITIMQDVVAFERLDDILDPGGASGTLYVGVEPLSSAATESCTTYSLEIRF